jgi:hypothetical protein
MIRVMPDTRGRGARDSTPRYRAVAVDAAEDQTEEESLGEPDAGKLACPVREGTIGNVRTRVVG